MSKNGKAKKKPLEKRSGVMLVALLAVMILIVNIVAFSYSWYQPAVKPGTGMSYNADVVVRSNNCSITSIKSASAENARALDAKTGELIYDSDISGEVTIPANQIYYFQITITNSDAADTNVSLYIKNLPFKVNNALPGASSFVEFGIGVAEPSNSYRRYTTAQEDFYIVRNAHIFGTDSEGSNVLHVNWFIKTGSASVSFNTTDIYVNYN